MICSGLISDDHNIMMMYRCMKAFVPNANLPIIIYVLRWVIQYKCMGLGEYLSSNSIEQDNSVYAWSFPVH